MFTAPCFGLHFVTRTLPHLDHCRSAYYLGNNPMKGNTKRNMCASFILGLICDFFQPPAFQLFERKV